MVNFNQQVFTDDFLRRNIFLDCYAEIEYDEDEVYNFPVKVRFPIVNLVLQSTGELDELADEVRIGAGHTPFFAFNGRSESEIDRDGWYNFYINLSGYGEHGVENCISFIPDSPNVDDDKDEYELYLTDKEQETMAKILDAQLWEFTNMGIKEHIEAAARYLVETN